MPSAAANSAARTPRGRRSVTSRRPRGVSLRSRGRAVVRRDGWPTVPSGSLRTRSTSSSGRPSAAATVPRSSLPMSSDRSRLRWQSAGLPTWCLVMVLVGTPIAYQLPRRRIRGEDVLGGLLVLVGGFPADGPGLLSSPGHRLGGDAVPAASARGGAGVRNRRPRTQRMSPGSLGQVERAECLGLDRRAASSAWSRCDRSARGPARRDGPDRDKGARSSQFTRRRPGGDS